jgi:hypothetical protein
MAAPIPRPVATRVAAGLVPVVLFLVLTTARSGVAAPAEAQGVRYRPPVDGRVIDPFRAPEHRYGPGNRGIDYAVEPLSPVRAAADGEVIFAGPVAGTLHVTVRHADGLRSTCSFLADIAVHVGQVVKAGDVVGRATEVLHFGVRDPEDNYLDPARLFTATGRARLVPGGDDGTTPTASTEPVLLDGVVAERRGPVESFLARALPGGASATRPTIVDRTRLWAGLLAESTPAPHRSRLAGGLVRWARDRTRCTPASDVPPGPTGRRILIEVGGIGSTSEAAAVADVDRAGLGYAPDDVVRFSYGGGRVPAAAAARDRSHPLARMPASSYTAADSQADLRSSGDRLSRLITEVAEAEPGVPIDLVAHSQGGLVARLALEDGRRRGRLPGSVATLVTVGSPHQGADVAAGVQAGRLSDRGRHALSSLRSRLGVELDPDLPAGAQLAPGSDVIDELRALPPPASVRVVSIGARGDVVVPALRTVLAGAPSTVVDVVGPRAHDRLPGSPEVTREIALAVAGRQPTCRALADVAADLVQSGRISRIEAGLGLVVASASTAAGAVGPERILAPHGVPAGGRLVAPPSCWPDLTPTQYTRPLARRTPGPLATTSSPGSTHGHDPPVGGSCRAPVSSNRGKETTQWHLSSRCGSSSKLASTSAIRPAAGTRR